MIKVKDGYAKLVGTTASGSASHILLSNGGVKAVSDFAAASALDNYLPLSGGVLSGHLSLGTPATTALFLLSIERNNNKLSMLISGANEGWLLHKYDSGKSTALIQNETRGLVFKDTSDNYFDVWHSGNLKNLSDLNNDLYWANINITSSPDSTKIPTLGGLDVNGNIKVSGSLYINSLELAYSSSALAVYTPSGKSWFGMMNTSFCHIYTDAPAFYFNKPTMYANGNLIWHEGNDGSGSGLDADLLDGKHATDFQLAGNYLIDHGMSTSRPNGGTFTLPVGANGVSMRSKAASGTDIGIFLLTDDNAFICNSSDNSYLFATFDTDKTADFSSPSNAAFAVLSDHVGAYMKGSLTVDNNIVIGGSYIFTPTAGSMIGTRYSATDTTLYNRIKINAGTGGILYNSGTWTSGVHAAHQFLTGGSSGEELVRMVIMNTTGYVGIGTDSPTRALDVEGVIRARLANNKDILLEGATNDLDGAGIAFWNPSSGWHLGTINAKNLIINTASSGNVGIGDSNPAYKLEVAGSICGTVIYANRDASTTAGGVSLYSNSDPMTYGIAFRGTGTYGTHGYVTAANDWATYLTMSDTANRGWIFRRGATNVASIAGSGNMAIGQNLKFSNEAHISTNRSTDYHYGYTFNLTANEQSIGMYSGPIGEAGGVVISPDGCLIYNSSDCGYNLQVRDKDLGADLTNAATLTFGIEQTGYYAWSRGGFKKNGSDDSYVLLGGGGHKLESNLSVNYANSASNADTVNNLSTNSFYVQGRGSINAQVDIQTIPKDTSGGWMVTNSGWTGMVAVLGQGHYASNRAIGFLFKGGQSSRINLLTQVDNTWGDRGVIAYTSDIPTTMAWDSITGKPSTYTPSTHYHNYFPENTAVYFRDPNNASWRGGMYWGSAGNEALCFVAVNANTSFRFFTGSDIANWTSSTWQGTPAFEVNKNGAYAPHFYESSDIRYKTIINNLAIKANQLANLPLFDFKWLDNEDLLNTGTSAQAVQELLPYIVSGTDKLTLDYGVLGTIAGITACRELTEQEKEINELKEQIKFLKDEINNLKTNKLWQS